MIDLTSIISATKDIVKDLTNIVGLIEENISSYDRITVRFRRKRIVKRLIKILEILSSYRYFNAVTLWEIAERATRVAREENKGIYEDIGNCRIPDLSYDSHWQFSFQLEGFLIALLETRDLIDEYKKDIIGIDYRLYEELDDAIQNRIDILTLLSDSSQQRISADKLMTAYAAYAELVNSISSLKDELEAAIKKEQS